MNGFLDRRRKGSSFLAEVVYAVINGPVLVFADWFMSLGDRQRPDVSRLIMDGALKTP